MPGGKGNIRPEDGKQFSSEYQPAEKWTEGKALQLGNELIEWLKEKDEEHEDKGHIFYKEFLVIENNYDDDLITYLSKKFTSFSEIIKKAKQIQEIKLVKFGVEDRLQPAITIFCLKNHHDYKDRTEIDQNITGDVNISRKKWVK